MVSRAEVRANAGMDSEFGLSPESGRGRRGRQRMQFFLLGFFCLSRVFV